MQKRKDLLMGLKDIEKDYQDDPEMKAALTQSAKEQMVYLELLEAVTSKLYPDAQDLYEDNKLFWINLELIPEESLLFILSQLPYGAGLKTTIPLDDLDQEHVELFNDRAYVDFLTRFRAASFTNSELVVLSHQISGQLIKIYKNRIIEDENRKND